MKKIILSLSALFVLLLAFTACDPKEEPLSGGAHIEYPETPAYTAATEVEALRGYTYVAGSYDLLHLKKTTSSGTVHTIYNIKGGNIVKSLTADALTAVSYELHDGFFVEKQSALNSYTVTVYKLDGSEILSRTATDTLPTLQIMTFAPTSKAGGALFGNDIYRIDGDTWTYICDVRDRSLPDLSDAFRAGNLLHVRKNNRILTYDTKTMLLVSYFDIPATADTSKIFYMENGSYLVQITERLDPSDDYYTYIDTVGDKYDMMTYLVTGGYVEELYCEYLFGSTFPMGITPSMLKGSPIKIDMADYDLIVSADYRIDGGRLIPLSGGGGLFSAIGLIGINEDGRMEEAMMPSFANGLTVLYGMPNGFSIVFDAAEQSYLYHAGSGLLLPLSSQFSLSSDYTYIIAHEDKAYRLYAATGTAEEITAPEGYKFDKLAGSALILSKKLADKTEYYRYTGTDTPEYIGNSLTSSDTYVSFSNAIILQRKDGKVNYIYGSTVLITYENANLRSLAESTDKSVAIFYDISATGGPVYYRVTAD